MYQEINFSSFCDAFRSMRPDNFSYDGLKALFNYLESYEEDTGEKVELDVIALCCDYQEYEDLEEYNKEHDPVDSINDINDLTTVIPIDKQSFIIQQF